MPEVEELQLEKWWRMGWCEGIAVDDEHNYLYVGCGALLHIYDISLDPFEPVLVARVELDDTMGQIHISGDYLYSRGQRGLSIYDISNRVSPRLVGRFSEVERPYAIFVEGDRVYLSDLYELKIIDVSDKSNPRVIGAYPEGLGVLCVKDNIIFALSTVIKILDASDPSNVTLISEISAPAASKARVWSNYLFVTIEPFAGVPPEFEGCGLLVYDISDLSNPTLLHKVEAANPSYGWDLIEIIYPRVYVGTGYVGIGVYDISAMDATTPPVLLGTHCPGSFYLRKLAAIPAGYVYTTHGVHYGFTAYDARDPANIVDKKFLEEATRVFSVTSTGNQYFWACGDDWILTFDVTKEPLEPIAGVRGTFRGRARVFEQDGRIYLLGPDIERWGAFALYDVTDPYSLRKLWNSEFVPVLVIFGPVYDKANRILWLTGEKSEDGGTGCYILSIDISDPENPSLIEEYKCGFVDEETGEATWGYYYHHSVFPHSNGLYLYLIARPDRTNLVVYRIRDNKHLEFVKEIDLGLPSEIGRIAFDESGTYAYIGTEVGIHIADVSDPENPEIVGSITESDVGRQDFGFGEYDCIVVRGDRLYATARVWGVGVIDVSDKSNPILTHYSDLIDSEYDVAIALNKLVVGGGGVGVYVLQKPSTSPLPDPVLKLRDPVSGDTFYTNHREVDVDISNDEGAVAWLLAENQDTKPSADDARWSSTKPTSLTLSDGEGIKTVYLWIKDDAGNINDGPVAASIVYDISPPSFVSSEPPDGSVAIDPLSEVKITLSDNFRVDEEGTLIEVRRDGEPFSDYIVEYGTNEVILHFSNPPDGVYEFGVTPKDRAGNYGTQATFTITQDTTIEQIEISAAADIEDAYINEYWGGCGDYPYTFIGKLSDYEPGTYRARGLIKFNLSAIPSDAEVLDAEIRISVDGGGDNDFNVRFRPVLKDWAENEVTWNQAKDGEPWSSEGGDAGEPIAEIPVGWTLVVHNDALRNLAQGWVSGEIPNYGIMLEADDAPNYKSIRILQKDSGSYTDQTKLIVTYRPPGAPLTITNIQVTNITQNSAAITWQTNKPATSLVKYGLSPGDYTSEAMDTTYSTSHQITLTNLNPNTTYYFIVNSTDAYGNSAQSSEHSFMTLPVEAQIHRSKTLRCVVPVVNKSDVPGDCRLYVFIADAGVLSDATGDLNADFESWQNAAELEAQVDFSIGGLETVEVTADIPAAELSVGVKDVCFVLSVFVDGEEKLVSERKVAAPIEIIE